MLQLECNLSTLMGKRRWTIQEVHERSGLSRNTISSLYNDRVKRIDYDTVVKLCGVFNCDIGDLLSLTIRNENSPSEGKGSSL
jgi:putative transcriptional regulator